MCIATIISFFICPKNAFGYSEESKDYCGYWKHGNCFISLTRPDGQNYRTLQINFTGPNITDIGNARWDFAKESHNVTASIGNSWGDTNFGGELIDTKLTTYQNAGSGMTIVKFRVKWKLPAHYTWYGGSTNPVFDRPANNSPRFNCTDDGIQHHTSDSTFIATYEINLSNTGLISPADQNIRRTGCAARIKIYQPTYTFTYYTNGGTVKDLNEGTKSGDNVVYSRSCGAGLGRAPSVERPGYTFDGWYYDNGTKLQTSDNLLWLTNAVTICNGNQSVTARWTAQSQTVKYDLQGGSYPEDLKKQTELNGCVIIPNGTYYMKSNCGTDKYMHVYGATYTQQSGPATVIHSGFGNQMKWIFERYKNTQYYYITSVHNGLALSLASDPSHDQSNEDLELWSHEKEVDDYFWYLKDEGNGHVSIYNKSTNKCLDVKNAGTSDGTWVWQYAPNHSYAQWWDLITVSQQDYPDKTKYAAYNCTTPTNNPVRGVDKFLGWDTNPNATTPTYKSNNYYTAITGGTVTLYAIYQSRAHITFDANGGSTKSLPKPVTINVGEAYTLPDSSSMARNDYIMIGWSEDPHAKKNYFSPGQEITLNKSGEHVMYAIWQNVNGNADLSNVISGNEMFKEDSSLQGGDGTTYNSIHDGLEYAHPDGGIDDPGYYTEKDGISQSNSGE